MRLGAQVTLSDRGLRGSAERLLADGMAWDCFPEEMSYAW